MKTMRYIKAIITLKPVVIDGLLYVCIALFLAMEATFSSDDVYKYVNAHFIFWAKALVGWMGAAAGALKMFRSTTYSDHLANEKTTKTIVGAEVAPTIPGSKLAPLPVAQVVPAVSETQQHITPYK